VKDGSKFVPANEIAKQILLRDEEIGLPIHCFSEIGWSAVHAVQKDGGAFLRPQPAPTPWSPRFSPAQIACWTRSRNRTPAISRFNYSTPFTVAVICDLLGIPKSMLDEMRAYADASPGLPCEKFFSDSEAVAVAETLVSMHTVVRDLLDERRANPKQDLLTTLTQATIEGAPLSLREQVYIVEEVVMGGSETTANAINAGIMYLGSHPELQDRIRKTPQQIPALMEEFFCGCCPPIQAGHRPREGRYRSRRRVGQSRGEGLCRNGQREPRRGFRFKCPVTLRSPGATILNFTSPSAAVCIIAWGAGIARIEHRRVSYESWLKRFSSFELMIPYESIRYSDIWVYALIRSRCRCD